jgi:monothiol glutaredoxin
MGILSRIKRRLPIIGRKTTPRPAEVADRAGPKSSGLPIAAAAPTPPPPPSMSAEEMRTAIEKDVKNIPVLLYMKGNAAMPRCGFSAAVVDILRQLDVPFETRDVYSDPTLRQEIKEFSDWPTLPQLYLGGEFVGGCDIVREMHENGELKDAVGKALA